MRSAEARRFKELLLGYCGQLGLALADMPLAQQQLVRLAASTSLTLEKTQAQIARGEPTDADMLVRLGGLLARTLDDLQLTGDGLAARQERERQAQAEADMRAAGIPVFKR
jgi:hypothetical protein